MVWPTVKNVCPTPELKRSLCHQMAHTWLSVQLKAQKANWHTLKNFTRKFDFNRRHSGSYAKSEYLSWLLYKQPNGMLGTTRSPNLALVRSMTDKERETGALRDKFTRHILHNRSSDRLHSYRLFCRGPKEAGSRVWSCVSELFSIKQQYEWTKTLAKYEQVIELHYWEETDILQLFRMLH